MSDAIRKAVAPAYLLLCLFLGGSAQGIWANALLQLVAIGIIAWALLDRRAAPAPRDTRTLSGIIALAILLVVIQLVPLPPSLWTLLPGRTIVAEGLAFLGLPPGWQPLSLGPYDGLATVATLLPPLAMLAAIVRLGLSSSRIALAVVAATAVAVMLGALQVTSDASVESPWYFYPRTNFGLATGFFANSNHMATLLLVAIPFVAALAETARSWPEEARQRSPALIVAGGALAVILVGLALNGSLAGFGLVLPVTIASLLLIVRPRRRWLRNAAIALGLVSFASFFLLVLTPLGERFVPEDATTSVSTRQVMLGHGIEAYDRFGPAGTGLGTFRKVYRLFENPAEVDRVYVNHAHNDYLELAIEMGVPGILLILLFLAWWTRAAWRVGRSQAYDQYAAAGAISSAAILVHSVVDYPLRTAAVSALFAACLALMMMAKRSGSSKTDLRPARHLVID